MTNEPRIVDILGIKPIAESINSATNAVLGGASAFLGRICLPAAEEFGLLLRDRVRGWRAANIARIALRAEEKLSASKDSAALHAHPRMVAGILEQGSWIEDSAVQDMWAGLLSSSCTESGDDDSNLVFVNLLADLTKVQARLLNYSCETARLKLTPNGFIWREQLLVPIEILKEVTGEVDIQRLDREMDHLREAGLIDGGFDARSKSTDAEVSPTSLGLHMYVRCQGSRQSPTEFFREKLAYTQNPPVQ